MPVDDELLARTNTENEEDDETDESEMAGDFRAEKRQSGDSLENSSVSIRELRQQVLARKKVAATQADSSDASASSNPMRKATDKLLQAAWEYLIPSWGLTLIWIDIHVFLNKALGPWVFCDLGEEWIPAEAKKALGQSSQAKDSMILIKKTEEIGCGCLNLGCLAVVIGIIVIIALIAEGLADPFQALWNLTKAALSSFFDIF